MGHTGKGELHIIQLGDHRQPDGGGEDPPGSLANPGILHGGHPHDGGRIDRIAAMGDAGDMKTGIEIGQGVKTGMVTEGPFPNQLFRRIYIPFDHKIGIFGDPQFIGKALDEPDLFFTEKARQKILVHIFRHGGRSRIDIGGVAPEGHRHGHPAAQGFVFLEMAGAGFMAVPVHARHGRPKELHAVHAGVGSPGFGIQGMHRRQRDEPSSVGRPALQHRQPPQIGSFHDHLLAAPPSPDPPGHP